MSDWWEEYLEEITVGPEFVRVAGTDYPPHSINPAGSGRYGKAIYIASGIDTALKEATSSKTDQKAWEVTSGSYVVFNQRKYCQDHPVEARRLTAKEEDGGHGPCRDFRDRLEKDSGYNISGILYDSAKESGGINLAVWNPKGGDFDHNFFSDLPKDLGSK